MRPTEIHKHHSRQQVLKVIEHLREARQKLNYGNRHLPFITGVPECNQKYEEFISNMDSLYRNLDRVFNMGVALAHTLQDLMENKDDKAPPIEGMYLKYSDMTPLQRSLIREGHELLAKCSRNSIPSHYYEEPAPLKPVRILTDLDKPKPKSKRRKLDHGMPL